LDLNTNMDTAIHVPKQAASLKNTKHKIMIIIGNEMTTKNYLNSHAMVLGRESINLEAEKDYDSFVMKIYSIEIEYNKRVSEQYFKSYFAKNIPLPTFATLQTRSIRDN
jgi:hypothetical protein